MHRGSVRFIAIAMTLWLAAGLAGAQPPVRGPEGAGSLSAEQAADQARKRYGGRVLDVRPLRSDGAGSGYRVKLLDRGEVRSVTIPSRQEGKGRGKGRAGPGR